MTALGRTSAPAEPLPDRRTQAVQPADPQRNDNRADRAVAVEAANRPRPTIEILPPLRRDEPAQHRTDASSRYGNRPAQDDNVVYLRPDDAGQRHANIAANDDQQQAALPGAYTPFIAQQLAQEATVDTSRPTAEQRYVAAAHNTYRQVAGDSMTLLGPVRPASVIV
jgi:hypothetical protein